MVVAIIVVLLALLVPALSRARFEAQSMQCLSNLRIIGNAVHAYAADNDGGFPWDAPPGFPVGWPQRTKRHPEPAASHEGRGASLGAKTAAT